MAGCHDLVIAAGVESMTRVPMFSPSALAKNAGMGSYRSAAIRQRFGEAPFSQFTGAQMMADRYGLDREALDRYALDSHRRAARATESGAFADEIVPVPVRTAAGERTDEQHRVDEGIRFDATLAAIGSVKLLAEGGVISAANASQISDGASGVMVASEAGLKAIGCQPLARIHQMTVIGHDPVIMLEAPLPATTAALKKAGLAVADIDLFEVNEAFASVPLAWLRYCDADPGRLNVHGGAIALGHPLGASGTKLMTTLVHALGRTGGRYGLQTMCEGGGMANVTLVERL
jgi:acetyl-CoA C-acetyltransferase